MKAFFSAEDIVESLYRALLQREAEPEGLATHAADLRRLGPAAVVQTMLASEDFRVAAGLGARQPVTLIGNCNAPILADCLRTGSNAWVRWSLDVNDRGKPHYRAALGAVDAGHGGTVISVPFGEDHPDLFNGRIKALYGERYLLMTNIHFTGLHPDIMYFGSFGNRVYGPMGDYHSRIILLCYLHGMDERDCLARFNARSYEALGYFTAWEASAAELRRREAGMDIRFADEFIELTRHRQTLRTMNHPTNAAFVLQAECIARHLGLAAAFSEEAFANPLDDHARWPIYPEIRETHGLPYKTEASFLILGRSYELEELIAAYYHAYDERGRQALLDLARAEALPLTEL
jgi:hypothetical protein